MLHIWRAMFWKCCRYFLKKHFCTSCLPKCRGWKWDPSCTGAPAKLLIICDYQKEQLFTTHELFSSWNVENPNYPKPEDTEEDGSDLCQGWRKHVHYYSRLHNKIIIRTQRIQVSFSPSLKYLCRSIFAQTNVQEGCFTHWDTAHKLRVMQSCAKRCLYMKQNTLASQVFSRKGKP